MTNVTLMRTTADENRQIAEWLADKLNRASGPVRLVLPEKGVSMLDQEGHPFWNPEADAALFDTLERCVVQTSQRKILGVPYHINDAEFAAVVDYLVGEVVPSQ